MAAAFLFPDEIYSLGNHGFYPIVDRIRAAASADESALIQPIVQPTDEGFDFLILDYDVSARAFSTFYRIAVREHARCSTSNEEANMHPEFYNGIMAAWSHLIDLMAADPRCGRPGTD